jgi:hypothetical protein
MSARWRECVSYSRRNSAKTLIGIWKPHVENVSLDWILNNTAYFSFLTFLFVIMVISLKILGCD